MLALIAITLIVLFGALMLLILSGIALYNRVVRLRTAVHSLWSDIDLNLKKRCDLVPNLVETVKGYAAHEPGVFERVTKARSMAINSTTPEDKAKSENMFGETLKSLFAVAEAYPELKANAKFQQLQSQLEELEDNIEYARMCYNAAVKDYNIMTETFPSNVIAGQFRFEKEEFFELEAPGVKRKQVQVSFS